MNIIWIRRMAFDTDLDRTTWIGMSQALSEIGFDVTFVSSFQNNQPNEKDLPFAKTFWIGPRTPSWKYLIPFLFRTWVTTINEYIKYHKITKAIVLDVQTFICAFPIDILSKLKIIDLKIYLDLRTLDYGAQIEGFTIKDQVWKIITKIALIYNKYFQTGVTVITNQLAKKVNQISGTKEIGVWSSGCSIPANAELPFIPQLEKIKYLNNKSFVVLYHGSLNKNRGLLNAIEGIGMAWEKGLNIHFVLIGKGPDEKELQKAIFEKGYSDCISIFPPVPGEQMFEIIKYSKLGIMTYPNIEYWAYNYPIKLAEYLSMGKPLLCTDILMFREAIQDIGCVELIPDANANTISCALFNLVNDPQKLKRMSEIAFTEAKRMTWKSQAKAMVSFMGLEDE